MTTLTDDDGLVASQADQRAQVAPASAADRDGITVLVFPPGERISKELASAKAAQARVLAAGVPRPVLIDISGVTSIDRDARAVLSGARMARAIALVGSSPVDRVLAAFLMGARTPGCPVDVFGSQAEALAWLRPFRTVT